jgi:hypothetical protein
MLILKNKEVITEHEIKLIISNLLFKVIENNKPYIWYYTQEPFKNIFTGKVSYDNSGNVARMMPGDLMEIERNLGEDNFLNLPPELCLSKLEELLEQVYIEAWLPSYEENLGKSFITYRDILDDYYDDWKNENFELNDEDDYLNEDLNIELDKILSDFLLNTSHELYYAKLLNKIK